MTGWKGSIAPAKKIKLKFSSLEKAIDYAKKENLEYQILERSAKKIKIKSYADNFKYNRKKSDID